LSWIGDNLPLNSTGLLTKASGTGQHVTSDASYALLVNGLHGTAVQS